MRVEPGKGPLLLLLLLLLVPCSLASAAASRSRRMPSSCKSRVQKRYPGAECHGAAVESDEACKVLCMGQAEEKCGANRGQVKKVFCRGDNPVEDNEDERAMPAAEAREGDACCCLVSCEDEASKAPRLDQVFAQDPDVSDICVEAGPERIKDELIKLCRNEVRVKEALAFCQGGRKGRYSCLKVAQCLGDRCRGCLKHECAIRNGTTEYVKVPRGFRITGGGVDVEPGDLNRRDSRGPVDLKRWCQAANNSTRDIDDCNDLCQKTGDTLCGGRLARADATFGSGRQQTTSTGRESSGGQSCCCDFSCQSSAKFPCGSPEHILNHVSATWKGAAESPVMV